MTQEFHTCVYPREKICCPQKNLYIGVDVIYNIQEVENNSKVDQPVNG